MDEVNLLILKAQQEDKDAFGKLYGIFYKRIYRYCLFNCHDQATAIDICQETFLKAWKSIKKFEIKKGGSFQAFLFTIARNLIIDQARKKKDLQLEKFQNLEAVDTTEEDIDKKSEKLKLKKALFKIKEKDRQLVILRFFEEMSFGEIAKITKTKEGALRVRIHRILLHLKEIIENGN